MKHSLLTIAALTSLAGLGSYAAEPLKALPVVTLSNNLGHFDHMCGDDKSHRLFVSDEDSNTMEVLNIDTGERLKTITGVYVPHNSVFLPQLNQLLATDGGGHLRFYDGTTYKLIREVKLLVNCDFMGYDPVTKLVYVTNGGHYGEMDHAQLSIVHTVTGEHLGDIMLPAAHIEAVAIEKAGPRIFVDASDHNSILVVDKKQKKVVDEWKIPGEGENDALTFDEKNKRLFVGCREPGHMVVFNTDSGKIIADLPIADKTDDMSFDAKRHRIYISGEDYVTVIQENDPDHYSDIGHVKTGKGGYTSTFMPGLGRFYVATRPKEGAPTLQGFQAQD